MSRSSLRYASAILRPLASETPAAAALGSHPDAASTYKAAPFLRHWQSSGSHVTTDYLLSNNRYSLRQSLSISSWNGRGRSWLCYGGVRGEATVSENVATENDARPAAAAENSSTESMTENATTETAKPSSQPLGERYTYQAEVSRLLDLIVNSLYSHKEVFLRELVSNASDALDKLRFLSVTDPSLMAADPELTIKIRTDSDDGLLIITDTGIGMTKDELITSLGTIARSGTANFVKALKENREGIAGDSNLIGKFGVGFYSAFLVAEKVAVSTKSPKSDKQYVWEADVDCGAFVIREETDPKYLLPRGTNVILYLKPEAEQEYINPTRIENLIKSYSQFISFPIQLGRERTREVPVQDASPPEAAASEAPASEAPAEGEKREAPKTITEKYYTWDVVNETKPLWLRSPKEISKEEYSEFYKKTYDERLEPMGYTHFNTEGEVEFKSLLFIPGMAPFGSNDEGNIKLYVKRVFISDAFTGELFPKYLNFMKGVIDSNDLPLNVSREVLQESRIVHLMRRRLTKKCFDLFDSISKSDNPEDYKKFWRNFGKYIKLGCSEDDRNQKRLATLLRFHSSKHQEEMTSLKDYVANMKPEQKAIYYFSSESVKSARNAPFLEQLNKRDYEVLFMTEPLDEVTAQHLKSFEGKDFVDISKEDFDLGDDDEGQKRLADEFSLLCDWIKQKMGDKIANVVVSKRLYSSPCALVSGKHGWSANMERIMRAHNLGDTPGLREYMWSTRILEINPTHPVIRDLDAARKSGRPGTDDKVQLLYQTALMSSGFTLEDPAAFGMKIYDLLASTLGCPVGGQVNAAQSDSTAQKVPASPKPPAPSETEAEILEDVKPESATA